MIDHQQILAKSEHELATLVAPMLVEHGCTSKYWLETRWVYLRQVVRILREDAQDLSDFVALGAHFFETRFSIGPEAAKQLSASISKEQLCQAADRFAALSEFTGVKIRQALEVMAAEGPTDQAVWDNSVRLAVSGMTQGPDLGDMLEVLGQSTVLDRLKKAIVNFEKR